jgi:hypothetical protein
VAEALAAEFACDILPIIELKSRRGLFGYLHSAFEASHQIASTSIIDGGIDPAWYDLVIIGTPVWGLSVSSPVRAYLMAHQFRFRSVAFFCTLGGAGGGRTFAQMRGLAGQAPKMCLAVTGRDIVAGRLRTLVATFAGALRHKQAAALTD